MRRLALTYSSSLALSLALGLAFALSSCAAPEHVDCPWPDEEIEATASSVASLYRETFGDDVAFWLTQTRVTCRFGERLVASPDQDTCLVCEAKAFATSRASVLMGVMPESTTPAYSHLPHELVHIALWNLTGEPDGDHEDCGTHGWTELHTKLVHAIVWPEGEDARALYAELAAR